MSALTDLGSADMRMTEIRPQAPTEQDAAKLVETTLHDTPLSVQRFPTGFAHSVYDVVTENQRKVVVRMSLPGQDASLAGALYWSRRLRPKGVPLPTILCHDLSAAVTPFPALIVERLAGTDLGYAYPSLSARDKKTLATELVRIQERVSTLPLGKGYGYVFRYDDPFPCRTWSEVVHGLLARGRSRITRIGIVDPCHLDRVQEALLLFKDYFARIPPRAFLDDTTTKNVIVDAGKLSGIVDVDEVCFGDPLFTIALTQMALLNKGYDLDYIVFWTDLLRLSFEEYAALQVYTCLFCVDFLSEIGQIFNKDQPEPIDHRAVLQLSAILDNLLSSL